jgi:tryptophan-rich sensory protein
MLRDTIKLIISIGISLATGILGGLVTTPNLPWYDTLQKPFFSPPNWLFGPVWIVLYILMGIALYLVWREIDSNKEAKTGIILFIAQLVFNFLWSYLFFGLHSILLSTLAIVILLALILLTTFKFYKVSKNAAYIMVPYILWVSFATILNISYLLLNP